MYKKEKFSNHGVINENCEKLIVGKDVFSLKFSLRLHIIPTDYKILSFIRIEIPLGILVHKTFIES